MANWFYIATIKFNAKEGESKTYILMNCRPQEVILYVSLQASEIRKIQSNILQIVFKCNEDFSFLNIFLN